MEFDWQARNIKAPVTWSSDALVASAATVGDRPEVDHALQVDARLAHREVASGALRGAAFRARLLAVPFLERDAWVDAVLGIAEVPDDEPGLPRESVPYLPCGVEEIVAMVDEAPVGATDEFVDLGAGLGRVSMLVHLLTGAPARGIELQASLVRLGRGLCERLSLPGVELTEGDATAAALDGSVFFFYAPFSGEMLSRALDRVRQVALRRPIVIGAVGFELQNVAWLRARATSCAALTVYEVSVSSSSTTS